jgi:antitoxin component YwqK of YwqJK toxin-antitoxin module
MPSGKGEIHFKNRHYLNKIFKIMRLILFFAIVCFVTSCGGPVNTGAAINLEGYETEAVPGTNITKVIKRDAAGDIMEEGYVSGGKRNGVWITFYDGDNLGKIKTMASYTDGILNGPYLELSNRGQIETEVQYANNQYNGKFATYKFGRATKEVNYKNNELDGVTKEYNAKGGVQKEINYKNGKQHGFMRYYNEEGEVTVEYEYDNGKKVSGGMVEK